jgi:hypothetical protein
LIGVILKKHKTRSSGLFFNKLPEWKVKFVFGGSVETEVNDDVGRYFQTKEGLDKMIHFTHVI